MNFDRDQKGFEERVEQGFKDAEALQRLAQTEMDQDRMEQKQHELQAAGILDERTQQLLASVGGASTDSSALDGALAGNVLTVKELGATRAAADGQLMDNMEGAIDADTARVSDTLNQEGNRFTSIREEHQATQSKLSQMEKMIMATQRLHEKKLADAKAVLDDRAKEFSNVLLLGGEASGHQPIDIADLKAKAKTLETQHDKLTARHTTAEQSMGRLLHTIAGQLHAWE